MKQALEIHNVEILRIMLKCIILLHCTLSTSYNSARQSYSLQTVGLPDKFWFGICIYTCMARGTDDCEVDGSRENNRASEPGRNDNVLVRSRTTKKSSVTVAVVTAAVTTCGSVPGLSAGCAGRPDAGYRSGAASPASHSPARSAVQAGVRRRGREGGPHRGFDPQRQD